MPGHAPFKPEVHDEQRRRVTLLDEAACRALAARRIGHQVAVGVDDVGIRRDGIGVDVPAAFRRDADDFVALRLDLGHGIVKADRPAQPLEMRDHGGDQRLRAALREPDAANLFELVDERVDARRLHRVAADEERMEAQHFAQLLVLHERRDERIDRTPRLRLDERRAGRNHRLEIEESNSAELSCNLLHRPSPNIRGSAGNRRRRQGSSFAISAWSSSSLFE